MYGDNRFAALGATVFAGMIAATSIVDVANADTLLFDTALANGVHFGNGNSNVGYTTNTRTDGLELGLGVSLRRLSPILPSPTNSAIYNVPIGPDQASPPNLNRSAWNFNWSVSTPVGFDLNGDHWNLHILNVGNGQTVDFDPSAASLGNAATTPGGFQNSENLTFGFLAVPLGYNMNAVDTYDITLSLLDANSTSLFAVSEQVNATPLPSSWLMLLSGFVGLGFFAYRGTKKGSAAFAAA